MNRAIPATLALALFAMAAWTFTYVLFNYPG
jgi:hypothetical protein